jgi:hypothetical protein
MWESKYTAVLHVVLFGSETWLLRVFQNWVVREIVGIKREKMAGDWRKMHNEELHDLYYSPNIFRVMQSRRMRWAGYAARVG